MEAIKKRSEVAVEDTWALERIYADDSLWEADFAKVKELAKELSSFQGRLSESKETLKAALEADTRLDILFGKVYVYAGMRYHQDTRNTTYQGMAMRCEELGAFVSQAGSFFRTEVLGFDEAWLKQVLEEEDMKLYQRMFEVLLRKKEHIRSGEVEELLAQVGNVSQTAYNVFGIFTNGDMVFDTVTASDGTAYPITQGRFVSYLENPDRELRKAVYESYYKQYNQYKNTLATLFSSNVNKEMFYATARKYASPRQASLSQNNIPETVYDSLIDAVHKYMPLMHRYVSLRKQALQLDELHMYDVYMPLVSEASEKIPYEEAKQMVLDGLQPLGEEYLSILKEGLENRWVDVYENEGKRSGAYSWGSYGTDPYVLLNYTGSLDSVFTLAHEMGHSLHSYYSRHNQPPEYSNYCLFVAEVASTCNEALLIHSMLKSTTDRKQRMYLINHFLEQYKGTIYRQTMFAEFERNIYNMAAKGVALTADVISQEYIRLNTEYFGPDMVQDEQIALEWARIPHFYTPFYVYQYATGFSAALAIANRILRLGEPAVEDYKKFLKGGSTMDPIDLLKLAGVDMTTSAPVEDALEYFGTLLDEFAKLQ